MNQFLRTACCILLIFVITFIMCENAIAAPASVIDSTVSSSPSPAQILSQMTLEEKVGQILLARCPVSDQINDIHNFHLGGYILFGRDFSDRSPRDVSETIEMYQANSSIPMLIAVDEEGGTVNRISQFVQFRSKPFSSPRDLYSSGGFEYLFFYELEKAAMLHNLGINVNMAPVCDITTSPSAFMYERSFWQDPQTTGKYIAGTVNIMKMGKIGSVLKHFPGYGENDDTHTGIAIDNRSLEELESYDLIPFQKGIDANCGAILVSHTIVTALDSFFPASLSPAVHNYLRNEMHFGGVIITDDLYMKAIRDKYGIEDAAVMAVLAGNDLICSTDYPTQYAAILKAVREGRIPEAMLDAAVLNVLEWKAELGIL